MGYYYKIRNDILKEFMKSSDGVLLLDWKKMGYSCARSLYNSFSRIIFDKEWSCNVLMIDGNVLLVKKNVRLPKDISKVKAYQRNVARPRDSVKSAILDFLRSGEKERDINWEKLGYELATCAYNSYKVSIHRYAYDDVVGLIRLGDKITLRRL